LPGPETNSRSRGGLPRSIQMEEFSHAYVHAIVSANGYQINEPRTDNKSVDLIISSGSLLSDYPVPDPSLNVQLKSTTINLGDNEYISYQLSAKNYRDLCANTRTSQVLILLSIPPNSNEWIEHQDITKFNTVGYYMFLRGSESIDTQESKTIRIPKSNVLTTDILHEWMCNIARGDLL